MTIVLTGGGSGGHITPLLAVAQELKRLQPDIKLIYIGQRGDGLADIPAQDPNIAATYSVRAGKWRRYYKAGFKALFDLPTITKNMRDAVWVVIGIWQSRRLLKRLQPDLIFIKGGFVGLPVGLAAAWLDIPYVTHDSDAIPGLANRAISRWAAAHAVALPKENYAYPPDNTYTVGIPLSEGFEPVTHQQMLAFKTELGLKHNPVILVTGGGQGALRLNKAVLQLAPGLLKQHPHLVIVHVVGRKHEATMEEQYNSALSAGERSRVKVFGFLTDLYRYSGAADLIITRAGATNLAEYALQGKACLVIPNPYLTGGHQLKNAQLMEKVGAIKVITEVEMVQLSVFQESIEQLLNNPESREELAKNIQKFAYPGAAHQLAELLLACVRG